MLNTRRYHLGRYNGTFGVLQNFDGYKPLDIFEIGKMIVYMNNRPTKYEVGIYTSYHTINQLGIYE